MNFFLASTNASRWFRADLSASLTMRRFALAGADLFCCFCGSDIQEQTQALIFNQERKDTY